MKRKIAEQRAIEERLAKISTQIPELVEELFSIQSEYLEQNQDMNPKKLKANTKKILSNGMKMIYKKAILACGIKEEDIGRDVSALMESKQFKGLGDSDKQQILGYANKYQQAMNDLDNLITDDLVQEFMRNSKETYDKKQELMSKTTLLAVLATVLFITAITTFILSFGILGAAIPVGAMIAATVVATAAEVPVIMSLSNTDIELALLEGTDNHSKLLERKCTQLTSQLQSELSTSLKNPEPTKEEGQLLKRLAQMEKLGKYNAPSQKTPLGQNDANDKVLKPLETACNKLNELANPSKGRA